MRNPDFPILNYFTNSSEVMIKPPVETDLKLDSSFICCFQYLLNPRDIEIDAALGLDRRGQFTALRVSYRVNIGAYLSGRSASPIGNFGGIAGVYALVSEFQPVLTTANPAHVISSSRDRGAPAAPASPPRRRLFRRRRSRRSAAAAAPTAAPRASGRSG